MLTCKQFVLDLLCDYLDATLGQELVEDLEAHLEECPPCVAYLNTYAKTRELVRQPARVEMPKEMKARLRSFLLDQLAKGGA